MKQWNYLRIVLCVVLCNSFVYGRRQPRIIGGDIINIEQAPFNVALQYANRQICGGAVMNERWVVTAAHCFGITFNETRALVRVGTGLRGHGGSEHMIDKIVKFPNFNYDIVDYDMALIKVNPPLTYSATVAPIGLPDPSIKPQVDDMLTVYGWGYTKEKGDPSYYLRHVNLPMFPHEECAEIYTKTLIVTSQMLCAGYRDGGRDACILDSGGPLVWNGALYGLVSWGWGCARPLRPGVFTDLSSQAVKDWIMSSIKE